MQIDSVLYISFLLASIGLIVIPGPNILVIVSTSLSHGKKQGLQTVMGTSLAMIIQLIIAALATTWLVNTLSFGFTLLKIFGIVYLLYLGLQQLRAAYKPVATAKIHNNASFLTGFFVSLSNPKTIVFFGGFLPLFVNPAYSYVGQLLLLSASFWILAMVIDSTYALLAAKLHHLSASSQRVRPLFSASIYFASAAWLAFFRR